MKLNIKKEQDITVVKIGQDIKHKDSESFYNEINSIIENEANSKIILDLKDCTYVCSSAIGAIIGLLHNARAHGGSIKIAGPNKLIRKLFDMTKVSSFLDIFKTKEEAASALSKT